MASQGQRQDGVFHAVGACILHVDGASQAELCSPPPPGMEAKDLVVAEFDDSRDPEGPALYEVQLGGKRHRLGKLRGFIGERMEARSFFWGLGSWNRRGVRLVARALSDEDAEALREGAWTPVIVVVEAQVGVFDVREFKKGDRYERDQRPGRALNALLRYSESPYMPTACKPFYNPKALKALTKRPLSQKDVGSADTTTKAKKVVDKAAAASKKRPAPSATIGGANQLRKTTEQ